MTVRLTPHYYEAVSPAELSKELASGVFRPVYYFYGTEDYRIKEAARTVVDRFIPKPQQTTNHTILSAGKSALKDILTELSVIPMLGEHQVFTINDIQTLSTDNIDAILSLLTPPDPNRVVIFISPSAKQPRKNSKIFKFLTSKTTPVEFPRLTQKSAHQKIERELKNHDIEIEPQALDILTELGGGDLGGITMEINKLIDFINGRKMVTREDVVAVTSDYQAYKVFELAECAAQGDFDKAISIIDFLLNRGEKSSGLLFWMSEHFIGLYLTQNRKPFGAEKKDISWKYRGQLNVYDNRQLERIIKLIAEADYQLRTGSGQDRLILERLIYHICTEKKNVSNA